VPESCGFKGLILHRPLLTFTGCYGNLALKLGLGLGQGIGAF
jgi:hypothetical protein